MPLIEGQILERKYEVTRLIARGGIGEVYLGINRRLSKNVAIKVLHTEHACVPAIVERFEQEARVAAMIRSAHIADVYDLGDTESGERFIVMELLEGEDLGDRLEREKRISEKALAAMALQILDALSSAHEAGIVHRDLKPENVFVTKRDGRDFVKVVDFGISSVVTAGHPDARRLTLDGAVLGTPLYMSPEQARGKVLDHRTDLYSLGVILYEAALGEPPFVGENVNDLLFRVAIEHVTPLELRLPSVSPALAAIVKKAMARAPDARFQTAAEMRDAVLEWQAMFVSGSASRASFPSFAEGTLAGHVAAPTPWPWSITQPDEEEADADVEIDLVVPRRRSKGPLVAFAMLCGLVAYGAMHPQDVRSVSDVVALRAGPLWRAAESKASAAITPPAAATAERPPALPVPPPPEVSPSSVVPPPPEVSPSSVAPPPSATPAATATTVAPKPVVVPPVPHALAKPEKKVAPPKAIEEPTAGGEPDGID
jgi:eukaryotic-like serine/threonine-protein kinase